MHRTMGYAHATIHHGLRRARRRLGSEDGQGTIEYVGVVLLVGALVGAIAKGTTDHDIAGTMVDKIKHVIDNVDKPGK